MKMRNSLLVCCLLACSPALWAEQSATAQNHEAEAWQGEPRRPDAQYGPEERRRLRGDLDSYSREAYPDDGQIEERRRAMREKMRERLREADADGDQSISREEARKRLPRLSRHFDKIDRNGDGEISREEMKAARERMRERREGSNQQGRATQ